MQLTRLAKRIGLGLPGDVDTYLVNLDDGTKAVARIRGGVITIEKGKDDPKFMTSLMAEFRKTFDAISPRIRENVGKAIESLTPPPEAAPPPTDPGPPLDVVTSAATQEVGMGESAPPGARTVEMPAPPPPLPVPPEAPPTPDVDGDHGAGGNDAASHATPGASGSDTELALWDAITGSKPSPEQISVLRSWWLDAIKDLAVRGVTLRKEWMGDDGQ